MFDVTASIVLYRNAKESLLQTINSFLATSKNIRLLLIDNSPTDALRELGDIPRCEYIFNNVNLGFGIAHNIGLEKILRDTRYHIILNPDVEFGDRVVDELFEFMETHHDVGLVMPKVLNNKAEIQHLARRLPSPLELVARRLGFRWLQKLFAQRLDHYEMRDQDYNTIFEAPSLSGCFMFFRPEALFKAGFFDDRYFMYMEDVDLSRRVHRFYKTMYYPWVHILHGHSRESYQLNKLLLIHVMSAIKYFNKWGWIFDGERKLFNKGIKDPNESTHE